MLGAEYTWGLCLEIGGDDPEVEGSPPALAFAAVIARARLCALAATPSLATVRFRLRHELPSVLVEAHAADDGSLDIQQPSP
jgi:hypothetical protein